MKLISKYGWSIVPQGNSFLYYEMNSKGEEIGYFRYSFENSIVKIDKDTYSKCKYGNGYKNILKYFENDAVVPSSIMCGDGTVIVTEFKDSYIHMFDRNDNLIWINESMGSYNNIYSLAYERKFDNATAAEVRLELYKPLEGTAKDDFLNSISNRWLYFGEKEVLSCVAMEGCRLSHNLEMVNIFFELV
ncbi:hypothetical protein [Clostridium saccharoperbutylacetonicum]|uniref:hypothetical protein n=1 Tax=Clostridium saccharoperbutylacetonicum TaxID=36745 RepID=UPI0039E90F99